MTDAGPIASQPKPRSPQTTWGTALLVLGIVVGFIGFAYIVVFFVSNSELPFRGLGSWNLVVGGPIILAGLPPRWQVSSC